MSAKSKLPITAIVATKNEELNISRCLKSLSRFRHTIVVDSQSTDETVSMARDLGAETLQFHYHGGYPKKRQWAMQSLDIRTPWTMLVDADESLLPALVDELAIATSSPTAPNAFAITKHFHFLGRPFRFGGFSHSAIVLFRTGKARFEHLLDEPADALDMEVHERLCVDGRVGRLRTPITHCDFKNLEAYIDRHNKYSTWESRVRFKMLHHLYDREQIVQPRLFGNVQERRRLLKRIAMRLPYEHWLWFLYHYVFQLGFLEGRSGWIASSLRANYIAQVNAKLFELTHEARP